MKLLVTINAGKVTQNITLPVGKGTQTFKWLGGAAAYRFVHDGVRHGGRHLSKRDRHTLPLKTQLFPKGEIRFVLVLLFPVLSLCKLNTRIILFQRRVQ